MDIVDPAAWHTKVITEFGPALGRIAAGNEFDPALRQDLLQDIHLALWRSFSVYRQQCSLRTWVLRIAHNTAASWVRRQKRRGSRHLVSIDDIGDIPVASELEHKTDESAVRNRLATLIQLLKPLDRDVILLWLEGLDTAEISDITGITAANTAQKIHRIRKALESWFHIGEHS